MEARKDAGIGPEARRAAKEILRLNGKKRTKSNRAPAGGARAVVESVTNSWLTPEEWEAILESLPEIEVDVAEAGETAVFGFRKLRDSRLSH